MLNFIVKWLGSLIGWFIGSFIKNAICLWVICWAFKAIGIVSIFGWKICFSWTLVILVTFLKWLIYGGTIKMSFTEEN